PDVFPAPRSVNSRFKCRPGLSGPERHSVSRRARIWGFISRAQAPTLFEVPISGTHAILVGDPNICANGGKEGVEPVIELDLFVALVIGSTGGAPRVKRVVGGFRPREGVG